MPSDCVIQLCGEAAYCLCEYRPHDVALLVASASFAAWFAGVVSMWALNEWRHRC